MEGRRGRNERKRSRGKNKTLSKQQEGQEQYLIQTMNIVVSSHSLHSQSSSTGRPGEPRNAALPGTSVRVAGTRGAGRTWGGLQGLPQPRRTQERGHRGVEAGRQSGTQQSTLAVYLGPVLLCPFLLLVGSPPLTSTAAPSLRLRPSRSCVSS